MYIEWMWQSYMCCVGERWWKKNKLPRNINKQNDIIAKLFCSPLMLVVACARHIKYWLKHGSFDWCGHSERDDGWSLTPYRYLATCHRPISHAYNIIDKLHFQYSVNIQWMSLWLRWRIIACGHSRVSDNKIQGDVKFGRSKIKSTIIPNLIRWSCGAEGLFFQLIIRRRPYSILAMVNNSFFFSSIVWRRMLNEICQTNEA